MASAWRPTMCGCAAPANRISSRRTTAAAARFRKLLDGTPLRIVLSDDFSTLAWRKLLINAVANPITTLTLQRQAVLRRPDIHALCLALLEEAVAVAGADGVKLGSDAPARAMETLFTFSGELGTSMYFDRLAGRQMEIEALTGVIVAKGAQHGIATPLNCALLTLLRAVNDAAERQSPAADARAKRRNPAHAAVLNGAGDRAINPAWHADRPIPAPPPNRRSRPPP